MGSYPRNGSYQMEYYTIPVERRIVPINRQSSDHVGTFIQIFRADVFPECDEKLWLKSSATVNAQVAVISTGRAPTISRWELRRY
jgi:hypothetical protein